jgi:hypothetical protein
MFLCFLSYALALTKEQEGENVFLCGGCRGCPKHGDEYMSYKCRYCCNEALYFCFGHTHYCDYCHSHNLRAAGTNYQYMTSAPPACEGRDKCPLKIDHAPHSEEFAIRCNACADEVRKITKLRGEYRVTFFTR